MLGRATLMAAIALTGLEVMSCTNPFSPPEAGFGLYKPIAAQTDPDSVLANFKYAYENRDIDIYEHTLASDFVFIYLDQDREGHIETVTVPRDGIGGDIYRTTGLFEAFDEIRLETWQVYETNLEEGDPLEWKARQVIFHLSLKDISGNFGYLQMEATGRALFKFKKDENEIWRIVVWEDLSIPT
ncbi:MAG: hypothetical protein CO189_04810 [candidate division Zixibacteria bacterium CG_4_9_14_3_um_filter_46_8]|nr:MAG: hypothetical protein CO189_04810 [candidate division Zixibacteria bacterium CG_4_9_14_3_um_filter_46_8]